MINLKKALVRHFSRFSIAVSLMALALVFGGGGSPSPVPEFILEIAALAALVLWMLAPPDRIVQQPLDRVLLVGALIVIMIPLTQLVPLPPSVWHALPGRALEQQSLALAGAADTWRPISLAPYQTLASLLALIPPAVMIFFTAQLTIGDRVKLIAALIVVASVTAIVGVIQVASGRDNWLRLYTFTHYGYATGFQANRNAASDILLIGLLSLAAFVALRRDLLAPLLARAVAGALALFLVASVILTGSRTGTLLLAVCAILAMAIIRPRILISRTAIASGVALLVLGGGLAFALQDNAAIDRTLSRFQEDQNNRPDLWSDTRFAIGNYWPAGAGLGTFPLVFPAAERLEVVDRTKPNRAHEDYLEFALETGAVGLLLLATLGAAVAVRMIGILRSDAARVQATQAIFAGSVLAILALHSLVDYPMRSITLATITAFAIALLSRVPRKIESSRQSGTRVRVRRAIRR